MAPERAGPARVKLNIVNALAAAISRAGVECCLVVNAGARTATFARFLREDELILDPPGPSVEVVRVFTPPPA